jgi:tetratricopeptide (TPR) repeat protein
MTVLKAVILAIFALWAAESVAAQTSGDPPPVDLVVVSETGDPARDNGEIFVAANGAYEQGDYAAAIGDYRELIDKGAASGKVHFNLGNAYLRHGELGRAIAQFRRGRNLLPRDEDIRANLTFARETTRDAIAPPEPSPVLSTVLFWHYRLSQAELARLAVLISILFWSLAILRLFRRESEISSWILMALLVVLVGTLGSVAGHRFFSQPVAVVVPQEIDAFTAPDAESVVRFKLHAGTELRVKDEREGWLRIVLPEDQQGWVEAVWAEVVDD